MTVEFLDLETLMKHLCNAPFPSGCFLFITIIFLLQTKIYKNSSLLITLSTIWLVPWVSITECVTHAGHRLGGAPGVNNKPTPSLYAPLPPNNYRYHLFGLFKNSYTQGLSGMCINLDSNVKQTHTFGANADLLVLNK